MKYRGRISVSTAYPGFGEMERIPTLAPLDQNGAFLFFPSFSQFFNQ